jgi:hypothetical protein
MEEKVRRLDMISKNILLQRVGNVFNWSIKNVKVLD